MNRYTNLCECPSGYFLGTSGNCIICTSPCLTCVDSGSKCLSCVTNLSLKGNQCETRIQPNCLPPCVGCVGTYLNNSYFQCDPCTAPCATCTGTATFCNSCTSLTSFILDTINN